MLPLVLLAVLISLVPLAHAVPPDQMWIAGLYDAADLDDAVINALSIDAATKVRRPSSDPLWFAGDGVSLDRPELDRDPVPSDEPLALPPDVRCIDSARSPPLI